MTYGIMFCGNSSNSNKLFLLQMKIIKIITCAEKRERCGKHFKKFHIISLASEYLLGLNNIYN
jgi:hypothetical protein